MAVKTECGDCMAVVKVDVDAGTATARIASNGKRGALHVPAHDATTQGTFDGTLILWECPVCGYADSTYASAANRRTLA